MDYRLPGKNGVEILKEIKKINPSQKVLIATIEKDKKVYDEFVKLGVSGILYKPFSTDELEKKVMAELRESEK